MNLKEIIPLLAAVIGLTPVILKWLNDRSTEAANRRLIQQAKEQVEFWQVWLLAQREVTTDERFALLKNEIAKRLDNLLEKNIEQENQEKIKKHEGESHSFFQKVFLLYLPHTTSGWIFHTLFYITVSFTLMLLLGLSIPPDNINAAPSWEYFKSELSMNITILLFFVIIAFILQRFANRIERHYKQKMKVPEK